MDKSGCYFFLPTLFFSCSSLSTFDPGPAYFVLRCPVFAIRTPLESTTHSDLWGTPGGKHVQTHALHSECIDRKWDGCDAAPTVWTHIPCCTVHTTSVVLSSDDVMTQHVTIDVLAEINTSQPMYCSPNNATNSRKNTHIAVFCLSTPAVPQRALCTDQHLRCVIRAPVSFLHHTRLRAPSWRFARAVPPT